MELLIVKLDLNQCNKSSVSTGNFCILSGNHFTNFIQYLGQYSRSCVLSLFLILHEPSIQESKILHSFSTSFHLQETKIS